MNRTVSTRHRLLAAAVAVQPLLIGINALFHPEVDLTAAGILRGAAESPLTWYAVHLVAATGALLAAPAALGLRSLVGRRAARAATLGVLASFLGSILLSAAFFIEASLLRLATGLEPQAALALTDAYTGTPEFFVIPLAILLGGIGTVLLSSALLASRAVPRWQPITLVIGTLGSLAAAPGTPLGPIAFGVIFVASVFLAREIVQPTPSAAPLQPAVAPVAA